MREVVGVAVLHGGRVLAARRARPHPLAGSWELPGGKVEPGESGERAAIREVAEELGCTVEVTGWLAGASLIATPTSSPDRLVLRVATARLTEGDPVPSEHDAVRWLAPGQLDDVTWSEADQPFLASLRDLLGAG